MSQRRISKSLVTSLIMIVLGMSMLVYSSTDLYNLFCRVTGYGGTTVDDPDIVRAKLAELQFVEYPITVRFNADTDPNLPWDFKALENTITVNLGEERLTAYEATNNSDTPVIGTAAYNVTPHAAGPYFNKIECFCFEDQILQPGEKMHMPVSFFIDPAFLEDDALQGVKHITLSYNFFKNPDQSNANEPAQSQKAEPLKSE